MVRTAADVLCDAVDSPVSLSKVGDVITDNSGDYARMEVLTEDNLRWELTARRIR